MEVINVAQENRDVDKIERQAGIVDEEISSDSDSSDDDHDVPDGSAGNKQGPIDQVRDYKRREQGLHRQHRGIMQWKVSKHAPIPGGNMRRAANALDTDSPDGQVDEAQGGRRGRSCIECL